MFNLRGGLGRQLLFPLLTVVIVALTIVGLTIQTSYNGLRQGTLRLQQQVATAAASDIMAYLQSLQASLSKAAILEQMQNGDRLNTLLSEQNAYVALVYVDETGHKVGQAITRPDAPPFPETWATHPAFAATQTGEAYNGAVEFHNRLPYMIIAVPVRDEQLRFTGMIAAQIDLATLWGILSKVENGVAGEAYVVDRQANLVASRNMQQVQAQLDVKSIPGVIMALQQAQPTQAYQGLSGLTVIGGMHPVPGTDWVVLAELPTTEAYADLWPLIPLLAILVIGGGGVALGAFLYVNHRVVRPILELQRGAQRIGDGDLTHRMTIKASGELGELVAVFNNVTDQLHTLVSDLAAREQHLRTTVADYVAHMAEVAHGNLSARLTLAETINRADPLALLGNQLNATTASLQAMAQAADRLSKGDVAVDVTPQSEKDLLGNAFRQMISYQREMADAADLLAQGDMMADVAARSTQDRLGQAFERMIAYQKNMAHAANRLAQGDLTVEITPHNASDALGNAFATMIANLRSLVGLVQVNALQLATASEEINSASEQSAQATGQVAGTMQQITEGSTQQVRRVTDTVEVVQQVMRAIDGVASGAQDQAMTIARSVAMTDQLSTTIGQVANNAETGKERAVQAAETARAGATTIAETITGMQVIKERVRVSEEKVRLMGERSEEIGEILTTIQDIAAQTNLLALNAAIEAARAGQHGRGFAVVADHVSKLAEKSASSTKEIASLVQTIKHAVAEAVTAMHEGTAEVEAGVARSDKSRKALEEIVEAIKGVNFQVGDIALATQKMQTSAGELVLAMDAVSAVVEENTAATEQMAASAAEVSNSIEDIANISEKNSAATEEVSAAVEEVSAQAEEVTALAQSLSAMARELQALVATFKLP